MKKSNSIRKALGRTLVLFYASAVAGAFLFLGGMWGQVGEQNAGYLMAKSETCAAYQREKLSSFTTYFNKNDGGRCVNIRLAASKLDKIALQPYGELSFNRLVGARTKANGYQTAKVIVQGEFVAGIGGGVCQVSTTLYNAALLAGLTVTEFHAHSIRVGYVPLSRDAMVSSGHDLRLYNPHAQTVYFSVTVGDGWLRCAVYGTPTSKTYSIESRTLEELPIPPPKTVQGSVDEVVRIGQSGWKSESYLKTYDHGVLVSIRRLRSDEYAPLQGLVRKKDEKFEKTMGSG